MRQPKVPLDFPAGGYLTDYLWFWAILVALAAATLLYFRWRKGRKGTLLLLFATFLWTLVLGGETYYRYFFDESDSYGLMLTNFTWFRRHVLLNSKGFRDREWPVEKLPGEVRIAFVGDSFTMGWGVEEAGETFPGRVGAALEKLAPGRYDVRNYGQPGWTTGHDAELIDTLAERAGIDHVVLGYCMNDTDDLLEPGKWFNRDDAPAVPFLAPTTSFLADHLWFRWKLADLPQVKGYFVWAKEGYEDPAIFGRQTQRFRHIAETCRAANIRLDVVVFPLFNMWGTDYPLDNAHEKLAKAWADLGVKTIDLREAYKGIAGDDLVANRYDAHPNEKAHEIAAKVILERAFGVR
jgi:hypothetical protein